MADIYRRDIDGLRAVAVLPVLGFHAGLHVVRGGFVGVDIFFVISGFLITQLLLRDIAQGRFSIVTFYDRRIRRIMPALLAVLAATYLLGLRYCLPSEMVDLSKSMIAAALSASNFYFWSAAGYFDGPALSKPLLHTWSLAVEEQFYIFWPIFLYLGHRHFRSRLIAVSASIALASFLLSAVGAFRFPNATFYLPLSRLWELAVGALLAMGAVPTYLGPLARNALSTLGLVLITASVFLIDSDMPFPGLLALPACLGTALIILVGQNGSSWVGSTLSFAPVVGIGLVSYSLYLWHWPVVVFQKNYAFLYGGLAETQNKLLIIAISLGLGAGSWEVVEQPFRTGSLRPSALALRRIAIVGTAVALLASTVSWAARGFPNRFSPQELATASVLNYDASQQFRHDHCFLSGTNVPWTFAPECLKVSKSKRNVLLLGDSHAAELWSGLNATVPGTVFLQATAADCFPTVRHSVTEAHRCTKAIDRVFDGFLAQHQVDSVWLIARWKPSLLENVGATLTWMTDRHIHVTLFGPTAVFDSPVPRLMVNALRQSDPSLPQRHVDSTLQTLDRAMAKLAHEHGVDYVSLLNLLCPGEICLITDAGRAPLIFDREHFTEAGSELVAKRLVYGHFDPGIPSLESLRGDIVTP